MLGYLLNNLNNKVTSQKMSENEMGYRGSKSDNISVKEQRADASSEITLKYLKISINLSKVRSSRHESGS